MQTIELSLTDRQLLSEHTAAMNRLAGLIQEQRSSKLYSNKEVAKMLGKCPNTISNWVRTGKIARISQGGSVGIPQSEIDKIVRA
jgi:hypothetical protein